MPKLRSYLDDETLEQVKEAFEDEDVDLSDVLINTEENEYVPRERLNDKNEQIESLKDQIDQREEQIKSLKEDTQTTEEMEQKIEDLQGKNEQQRKEFEQKMNQKTKRSEVRIALAEHKARNVDAVESLLDMDEIEVEDGEVKGLDDQLKELRENESYLFEDGTEQQEGAERSGGEFSGATETPEENPWLPDNMNLEKQREIYENKPDLARHLIEEAGLDPSDYNL